MNKFSSQGSMNRSHTFVNSLKWWPLQSHNGQTSASGNSAEAWDGGDNGGNNNQNNNKGFIGFNKTQRFGSFVAVQKLRESKWFKVDEHRIFCAVVECGFIVEVRSSAAVARKLSLHKERQQRRQNLNKTCKQRQQAKVSCSSASSNIEEVCNDFIKTLNHVPPFEDVCHDRNDEGDDELDSQDEHDRQVASWFGIVLCKTTKDNKTRPDSIEIFSVKIRDNGAFRILKWSLDDIWNNDWELRINNFADKENQPHKEKDIRNQISFARTARHTLWHNTKHFTYWCRYGSRQQDVRKRQISECIKWGSIGMNAGMILLMNKPKSYSTSK